MAAVQGDCQESDSVFLEAADCRIQGGAEQQPLAGRSSGLLDAADSSSSSTSRKPSYDSRESKSISECSYASGSACASPLRPLAQATSYSSTCTMESDPPGEQPCLDPFLSEKEFIDYLMSLPSSKPDGEVEPLPAAAASEPMASGSQSPKIGLDHLENLCKLMEQLGELREQNFKLQKRVQYLEAVRCLSDMRKDLKEALDHAAEPGSWDLLPDSSSSSRRRTTPRGTLIRHQEASEAAGDPEPQRTKSYVKLHKSALQQQRLRSQSMGDDDMFHKASPTGRKAKVSKWTKVKEALKWERVQVENRGAVDARSSFFVDVDDEAPQPLMVSKAMVKLTPTCKPSTVASASCDDLQQKTKAGVRVAKLEPELVTPCLMTDPYFDSTSEEDEETLTKESDPHEKRRSFGPSLDFDVLDGDVYRRPLDSGKHQMSHGVTVDDEQASMKEWKGRSLERTDKESRGDLIRYTHSEKEYKKFSKGAWGKVKNIIQTRKDSLKRKHRKSGGVEPDFSSNEGFVFGDEAWAERYDIAIYGRAGDDDRPALGDPVAQMKSKHSSSSSTYGGEDLSLDLLQDKPRGKKGKAQQLTIQVPADDTEAKLRYHSTTPPILNVTASGYSPNSLRKSKWDKVKNVFLERRKTEMQGLAPQRPQSVPASPTNLTSFTYEDLGILEDYLLDAKNWAERKDNRGVECGPYDSSVAALQSMLADAEGMPAPIAVETKLNLEELQRNISQDFSKKMQEWEKLKSSYTRQQQHLLGQAPQTSPNLDRKGTTQKSRKGKGKEKAEREQKVVKQRDKELQWLEKQLQKIEREKQRLAKERQKYLKREARLEKMKETMLHPPERNEVLVRTSAGEFRFGGISQTFTRRLYEWEEMRGIGPEVSTIALLDARYSEPERVLHTLSPPTPCYGRLDHHRSRSESSLVDIANVQTSTTSLAPDDLVDDVFTEALPQSRATSEPDMAFELDESPCALEVEELHFEEAVPCLEIPAVRVEEPVYSYAPSEVTRLIDSSGSSDAEKDAGGEAARRHTTSVCRAREPKIPEEGLHAGEGSIQDEDLRLMQKLTAKEEVCRRLECDLEDLDGRMKMMFQQHCEEIQNRTSSPGSPVDTSKQRHIIGELRARIEELEKSGDCLKKERDDLEKTFKLNSEQQAQLTQHLAARITELQQKNTRICQIAGDQKLTEKASGQTKKKQDVVKVQEISAELLNQAKTLEHALLDRNITIRQLQWDLLQRDMSAIQLQTELQKVKDKTVDALGGNKDSKRKEKHERSWSSMEVTSTVGKNEEDSNKLSESHKPLNFQRFADNPDLSTRPLELTRKVRELKTELMRLWSSTESATSGSSEHGVEDVELGKEKDAYVIGVDAVVTAVLPDIKEPLSKQSDELERKSLTNSFSIPIREDGESFTREKKINPGCGKTSMPRINTSDDIVTARRVSDTAIPQDIKESSLLGTFTEPLLGKMTKCYVKTIQNEEKMEDSGKMTEAVISISKIPSRVCPLTPSTTARSNTSSAYDAKSDELHKSNTADLSITLNLKPQQTKTTNGQALRPERASRFKKMAAVSRPSASSNDKDSESEVVKSDSNVLSHYPVKSTFSSRCTSARLKPLEPSTTTDVVLPYKAPLKSEFMPYPKKSPSTNENRNALLQRQNAKDGESSSDTDTEGSGITFTINLAKKDSSRMKDAIAITKSENITARIPLRRSEKAKQDISYVVGYGSPNMPRLQLESRSGGAIVSPIQSPSSLLRRKLLREDAVIQRTGSISMKSCAGSSQIPAPDAPPRPSVEAFGSPPGTPKEQKETKPDSGAMLIAPETPVVKSRSTRKLKLPTACKQDTGVPSSIPSGTGLEHSHLRARHAPSRPAKDVAPNVKSMIEKYNQKLAEKPLVSLLRSPQLNIQRSREINGIQKSTSFTDKSATSSQQTPAAGECIFKSASVSTIEGSTCGPGSPSLSRFPPMSPESLKRTTLMGQPIGVASRIPRCLKPISEQDSIEAAKEEAVASCQEPACVTDVGILPSPAAEGMHKVGVRLMQLRRAREEFLTKNPALVSSSPAAERPQNSSSESDYSISPALTSSVRPCGWKPFASQTPPIPHESHMRRPATDSSVVDLHKPKGILKSTRRETTCTTNDQDSECKTDASGGIMRSASAGAMDEATSRSTSSADCSRTSETLPQTQKSGLFHFRFRKAKMKQKKEPLNTVKALCRQSLLVDIEPGAETNNPCSPGVGIRSCPSSPELQPRPVGKTGWLSKPRILFKSK